MVPAATAKHNKKNKKGSFIMPEKHNRNETNNPPISECTFKDHISALSSNVQVFNTELNLIAPGLELVKGSMLRVELLAAIQTCNYANFILDNELARIKYLLNEENLRSGRNPK